ncbi:MAG: hypothetical protein RLZZ338_89 [Cyanobacteriota bacterium]|jgi:hypothetical protein
MNNRSGWLWDISRHIGRTFQSEEIHTIPQLKKYLKSVWGKVPLDCRKIETLEGIAFKLGVEGAEEKPLIFPPETVKKTRPLQKSLISKEEIINLYHQNMKVDDIAKKAGVSRPRIYQIIKKSLDS